MSGPTARPFLIVLLAGLAAAWMNVGTLHLYANADSLVPVLVSLQQWTPFYWEQNRFGMLVPLIATPVRHPLANLLLQGWLTTTAALLAPYVVARCLTRGVGAWAETGALANVFLLVFAWPVVQFDWFVAQPYALSIGLAFGALVVLERPGVLRMMIGTALMLLAHWVNFGVFFLVLPATVVLRRVGTRSFVAATIGMAGGLVFAKVSSAEHTLVSLVPFVDWPQAWRHLLSGVASGALEHQVWLAPLVLVALATACVSIWRGQYAALLPASAAVVLASVYWLAIGTAKWVALNLYMPRYVYPSLSFLGVAVALLVLSPWSLPYRVRHVTWLGFVVAVMAMYGVPSPARLRQHFDDSFGTLTSQTLSMGAKVIAGSYWTVWPWVFHTNWVLYQQARGTMVYGLTHRSMETDQRWCSGEKVLVVASSQDREVRGYADRIRLPLALVRPGTSVDLFVAGPCPTPS